MRFFEQACGIALLLGAMVGCAPSNSSWEANIAANFDGGNTPIGSADFSPRFPAAFSDSPSTEGASPKPLLFPGADTDQPTRRRQNPGTQIASAQPAALITGDGVEMNFESADIQSVAKTLLGDILQLTFAVDPRVQGNITIASAGPIARKDVLPAFESVLRMSNAAIVRDGKMVKIVPAGEAGNNGAVALASAEAGFGVSVVQLRHTSAATVARTAESFLSRPGAIRVDTSRNLLLVQGTTNERQAALDMVSAFDVDWLRNQSVGVYPIKSTSPETMIQELERIFESGEGALAQGLVRFQPISRMNAVMVVAKTPKLLEQTTQWVQRLDRSDSDTTLRTYRLKYGNAPQIAKILNELFPSQQSAGTKDTPANQVAPGVESAKSKLDAFTAIAAVPPRTPPARARALRSIGPAVRRDRPQWTRSSTARTLIREQSPIRRVAAAAARPAGCFRICASRRTPPITPSSSIPIRRTIA
jgi:general secretion pathway protein D